MFAYRKSPPSSIYRICTAGAIALYVLGIGCAASPRLFLAEDAPSSRNVKTIALLPMNFGRSPGSGFLDGVERDSVCLGKALVHEGLLVAEVVYVVAGAKGDFLVALLGFPLCPHGQPLLGECEQLAQELRGDR